MPTSETESVNTEKRGWRGHEGESWRAGWREKSRNGARGLREGVSMALAGGCSALPRSLTWILEPLSIPSGKQSVFLLGSGGIHVLRGPWKSVSSQPRTPFLQISFVRVPGSC